MGRKTGLTSLFKTRDPTAAISPWPWPSCKHPRTHSFRAAPPVLQFRHDSENIHKTINSIFFDTSDTNSSSVEEAEEERDDVDAVIVEGLRTSDRLFFDPGGDTSSILEDLKTTVVPETTTSKPNGDSERHEETQGGSGAAAAFMEGSVAEEVESRHPYADFRASMEEMVATHGLRDDWDRLEELLQWYLKANGRRTHGFILGAFVDLLLDIATGVFSSKYSSITTTGCSSSSSCCSSSTSSSLCSCSCASSSCIKFVVDENDRERLRIMWE